MGLKAKNIENQKTGMQFKIDNCMRCPIVDANGETCDGEGSPYSMWVENNDPKPMIQILKRTLNHLKE